MLFELLDDTCFRFGFAFGIYIYIYIYIIYIYIYIYIYISQTQTQTENTYHPKVQIALNTFVIQGCIVGDFRHQPRKYF